MRLHTVMIIRSAVVLALSALVVGCGSSAKGTSARSPGSVKVAIRNYAYAPATLTVTAGTKVTFTNFDTTAHTATADGGSFDTGTIQPGRAATLSFSKPGTYTYHCLFHAFMVARITVVK